MPSIRRTPTAKEKRTPKGTRKKVLKTQHTKSRVDPILIKRIKIGALTPRVKELAAIKARNKSKEWPQGKLRPKQQRELDVLIRQIEKLKVELKANKPKRTSKSNRNR